MTFVTKDIGFVKKVSNFDLDRAVWHWFTAQSEINISKIKLTSIKIRIVKLEFLFETPKDLE